MQENNKLILLTNENLLTKEDLNLYLINGGNINHKANDGLYEWTALITACYNGYINIVELLLENGANPNITDTHDWTPIMWSSIHGHKEIIYLLIQYGGIFNYINYDNQSALSLASKYGHLDIILEFFDITKIDDILINLIYGDNYKLFRYIFYFKLIKSDYIYKIDFDEFLMNLVFNCIFVSNRINFIKYLINYIQDINKIDEYGDNYLFYSINNIEYMKLFIDKGIKINFKNKDNQTALLFAYKWNKIDKSLIYLLNQPYYCNQLIKLKKLNLNSKKIFSYDFLKKLN